MLYTFRWETYIWLGTFRFRVGVLLAGRDRASVVVSAQDELWLKPDNSVRKMRSTWNNFHARHAIAV